jgi:anti-sigma factor ChrR (cupin superfamily)
MPRTAAQRKTTAQAAPKKKVPQTKNSLKLVPTPKGSTYVKPQDMEWQPTPYKGIRIKVLYQDKAKGELTCLLKWEPGASLPFHKHPEIEQTWVLEGSFYDHDGIARAGEYVWRKPGSFHQTHSDEGAVILAIYRKPNVFYNTAGRVRAGYDT